MSELREFKFGLMAVGQSKQDRDSGQISVLHLCGYVNPPTENDKKALEEELNTDPEFGLVGRINKDVFIVDAPDEVCKQFFV
jgi:hypothetical protein